MAKGNDGLAARRRSLRKLLIAVVVALGITFVIIVNDGTKNKDGTEYKERTWKLGKHGGHIKEHSRPRTEEKIGGLSGGYHSDAAADPLATQYRNELIGRQHVQKREEALEGILNGSVHLVDLIRHDIYPSTDGSYQGVEGKFCKLDFALHKNDPSDNPMFRFIVQKSPDCNHGNAQFFDLKKVVYLARRRDQEFDESSNTGPKLLNLTTVAFHESRCGSTLVANSMIAMDPEKHRTYSESAPAVKAFNICGPYFTSCSQEQVVTVFKDTIYLMSRTDDHREERVFFKFQSSTSMKITTFQMAFPEVPWMYVYREPVQVMMSHVKDDPSMARTICTKSRKHPPREVEAIAKRHGRSNAHQLEAAEYCAAHLAQLTEAAVSSLNDMAIPVAYDQLPSIMWETIMPKILGRPMEQFEVENLKRISGVYSKGDKRDKGGEFKGDSEQKEKKASDEVRKAANEFLIESFNQLNVFEPKLLK